MDVVPAARTGSSSPAISVAIVDGDPLARRALCTQLDAEGDIEVVGEAPDTATAIDLVSGQRPDLALIDFALPDRTCSEAIAEVLAASPQTSIVVLALEAGEDAQIDALRAGAAGWLPKSLDLEALPRVLRGVRAGEAAVTRALGARLLKEVIGLGNSNLSRLRPVRSSLTQREWEVVDLMVDGATTAEIAEQLRVSPATVRTHSKHLLGKLGAHSREDAIRRVERLRQLRGSDPADEVNAHQERKMRKTQD
jgi:two-component system, NarL family, response regulator LiaR